MQLVIPLSGKGQRFLDAGYVTKKPFINIDGKPMICHVVDLFPGITDIVFICTKDDKEFLSGLYPLAKIAVIDPHKKGPVYAVAQAFGVIDDNQEVIVSYCDYGMQWDFEEFLLTNFGELEEGI